MSAGNPSDVPSAAVFAPDPNETRPFLLVEMVEPDDGDETGEGEARLFALGLQTPDLTVTVKPNGQSFGRFSSAEGAQALYSRVYDVRLLWLPPVNLAGVGWALGQGSLN